MPPNPDLRQEDFLYDFEWDAKIVNLFVDVLADQVRMGNFHRNGDNSEAIGVAQLAVNNWFKKSFPCNKCWRHELRKRYEVFKWILSLSGVHHDTETNKVYAPEFVWDFIFKKEPFAHAYQTNGDPNWANLKVLFDEPPTEELIVISSDEEIAGEDDGNVGQNTGNAINIAPLVQNHTINVPSGSESSHDNSFWTYIAGGYTDEDSAGSFKSPTKNTSESSYRSGRNINDELEGRSSLPPKPAAASSDSTSHICSSSASYSPWKK